MAYPALRSYQFKSNGGAQQDQDYITGERLKMPINSRSLVVLSVALMAMPAFAVPPPAPHDGDMLPLVTTTCSIDVTGMAQPYSPAVFRFKANAEDTFILINPKPDLNLNFSLGVFGETPLITGAGFGADVRIRLPRAGTYQLEVSSFDPIQMKARAADFELRLILRGEIVPQEC